MSPCILPSLLHIVTFQTCPFSGAIVRKLMVHFLKRRGFEADVVQLQCRHCSYA
jgi:hypothetical protein